MKLRHKNKVARYRFFVVPGDSPALLGMPNLELLGILKVMSNVVDDQHVDRKFDYQTMEPASALSCRAQILITGHIVGMSLIII